MKTEYTVHSRVPTLAEYIELCHAVGHYFEKEDVG